MEVFLYRRYPLSLVDGSASSLIFQVVFFCLQGREGDGEQGMNGTFENFSGPLSSAPKYDLRVEIGE